MYDSPAFVLAVISIVVAITSTVWQMVLYRLSGARLRLDIKPGVVTHRGTLVRWDGRRWPTRRPDVLGWSEDDLWFEVVELVVSNQGRTVVWVSDLGLDFGRRSIRRPRDRAVISVRPIVVSGSLAGGGTIRLEAGEHKTMYVPVFDVVDWAAQEIGHPVRRVRAKVYFAGVRTKRSPGRRAWRIVDGSAQYPHMAISRPCLIFRELLRVWPTSDISDLYEATLQVMIVLDGHPGRRPLIEVVEPFVPSLLDRVRLVQRLGELGPTPDRAAAS